MYHSYYWSLGIFRLKFVSQTTNKPCSLPSLCSPPFWPWPLPLPAVATMPPRTPPRCTRSWSRRLSSATTSPTTRSKLTSQVNANERIHWFSKTHFYQSGSSSEVSKMSGINGVERYAKPMIVSLLPLQLCFCKHLINRGNFKVEMFLEPTCVNSFSKMAVVRIRGGTYLI